MLFFSAAVCILVMTNDSVNLCFNIISDICFCFVLIIIPAIIHFAVFWKKTKENEKKFILLQTIGLLCVGIFASIATIHIYILQMR